ncbi:MAG TPA: tyrosinase family protein [Verrucomicrobiae bacterium]|nr:tyrosinase family protein [Verrucomicrobiae bacterium]
MKCKSLRFCQALCGLVLLSTTIAAQGQADLWIRDDILDVGIEPNTVSLYLHLSDDIWVRRLADPNYDPQPFPSSSPTWTPLPHEGPCYRDPKASSPNYIYVRVRNRGTSASSGTETLHVYWAKASTGLNWPGDWNDHVANPCGFAQPRLYGYEVTKPRSNAATVAVSVRNDYIAAVQTIDMPPYLFPGGDTYFDKQNNVHFPLFGSGIHGTLRFLPWHREFINRYEALLREAKPALTLLYWDWTTDPSPTIIGPGGYMGASSGVVGAPFATFGISRNKPAGAPGAAGLQPAYQTATLLPSGSYSTFWGNIEGPSHNNAHCYINGTMCSQSAARDPIFFMLHANADRLWAMWQRLNNANVDRWTPSQAYDTSQLDPVITSTLIPWNGASGISPWTIAGGYIINKTPTHHSIVYPPTYEDVLLKIPVLAPNECCIIEIPFYPPPDTECGAFLDPQHLCLLARIEPITSLPLEGPGLWQNVKNHNNIAWRNVALSDCNVGPWFSASAGSIGAAGELVRNFREQPALVTLRFDEAQAGFRSLFEFGQLRLRLETNLFGAWVRGGRQGQGVEEVGQNEIRIVASGATLAGLPLGGRELGHMDVALKLNPGYPEPFGDIYHLDLLQFDDQGGQVPVGGQRYDFDFNLLRIVGKGSAWKFLDGGQIPTNNWTALAFDDQSWKTGRAPFGYGRADVATDLNKPICCNGWPPIPVYFRQTFDVPDPSFYHNIALNLIQHHGIVVYLNGQEIARRNMPEGAITPDTRALTAMTGAAARACRSINVSNAFSLLVTGRNILAAEVHPASQSNQVDLTFDTELAGNVPSVPYQPPTVFITTPTNGGLFRVGSDVPILADVLDPDGDLSEVRIFTDGQLLVRTNSGPFVAVFRTPSLGGHRVSVEAEDLFGHRARMESVFTVVSNLVPIVDITSPVGQTFAAGSTIPLVAAAADLDGSVAKVEFYVRSHLRFDSPQLFVGQDQTAPYQAQISGLAPGHYMALAVATDNQGATGYSHSGHFSIEHPPGSPDITIRFENLGGRRVLTLEWDIPGAILQRASRVTGPWQSVPDAPSSYSIEPNASMEFYQLRLPDSGHVH